MKKKQKKEKASAIPFRAELRRIEQGQIDFSRNILDSPDY